MGMQNAIQKVLDQWSNLDYKPSFTAQLAPVMPKGWVPADDLRRIRAYAVYEAYCRNSARDWLQALKVNGELEEANKDRREYGDPDLLVETALSSLLGNEVTIVTQGIVNEEGQQDTAALDQQALLEQWAADEKFELKYWESERQAIKFGDSVYALGWDVDKRRPRLGVYDPGFYFPVFDPRSGGSEDFPNTVHLCWEFMEPNERGEDVARVRRITWRLFTTETEYTPAYSTQPTTVNCAYQDGIWELDQVKQGWETWTETPYEWITEPMWMNCDFIPVVHVPNTVNLQGHFGVSVLANVMQIIDDVQGTDTDLQASAATTGSPPIVVSGKGSGVNQITSYGPGMVAYVGEGSANILDTSRSLDALLKLKDALLSRLSINSRTPEALLGRVKPNEVPSGIALTLGFTPHIGLVREMRMVRREKYALLMKFVVRLFRMGDALPAATGPEIRTDVVFGSFLPADKQETMTLVQNLYTSKAISLETAVQMLIESGYPIEDLVEEISRIQQRDFMGATELMTVSGNPDIAMEYLGLDPADAVVVDPLEETDPGDDPDA